MAKQPMVTRTITTTIATILCLDIEIGEACNRTVTLPRTSKKEKEILHAAEKALESEPSIHPVHVVNLEVKETLYGMPESVFLAHATEIIKPVKPAAEAENK